MIHLHNKHHEKKEQKKLSELLESAKPLIKYLSDNHHPHVTAIVTSTSVELVEGIMNIPKFYNFIKS